MNLSKFAIDHLGFGRLQKRIGRRISRLLVNEGNVGA